MMRGRRREYLQHRETARALAHARIAHFNADGRYQVRAVRIRNSQTRWGSCSSRGNLNFHYRIALLPPPLVDYVVVHELCHLLEMNHSPRFWAHVEAVIPDYRERKRALAVYSRAVVEGARGGFAIVTGMWDIARSHW